MAAASRPATERTLMNRTQIACACALAAAGVGLAGPALAQNFTDWGNPMPVSINTPANEGCPIEAPDGLGLYIASNRPGGYGALDVWRFSRESKDAGWGPGENLGSTVNSGDFDYCPTPRNGRWLLYVSSLDTENDGDPANDDCLAGPPAPPPPGSPAAGDMFLTQQRPDGSWRAPMHLGCFPQGPNTPGFEFSPSPFETEGGQTVLYFSSNGYPDSQGQDIYASAMLADGTVLPGQRVAELSSPADDRMPNVRKDGLEIVFSSNRQGFNAQDVYVATRASTSEPWSAPVRIANPAINTASAETRASLSGDGTRLYFGRDGDVFVSTRSKLRGPSD